MNFKQRRDKAHRELMARRHLPRLFRKTYAKTLEKMLIDSAIFGSALMKVQWDKSWNQPVILSVEQGVCFETEDLKVD